MYILRSCYFFFFNDTATTEIYTLSLHDALPICRTCSGRTARRFSRCWSSAAGKGLLGRGSHLLGQRDQLHHVVLHEDRKSTRLNSSHANISYAVFCLKKKNYSY